MNIDANMIRRMFAAKKTRRMRGYDGEAVFCLVFLTCFVAYVLIRVIWY